MLQWIRKKLPGIVIWLVIGAITIVFFIGTSDFLLRGSFNPNIAAKVNNEIISVDTINNIYNEQIRYYQTMHKGHNSIGLDPQKIKSQIKTSLINNVAIIDGLRKSGFIITDEHIAEKIKSNPQFQDNGKFSSEKYHNSLMQASITEEEYHRFLAGDLLIEQLRNSLWLSNFTPETEVNNFINNLNQSRDFGYVVIPYQKFVNQQQDHKIISEQEIESYYQAHPETYVIPERVKINYVEISKDKLTNQATPALEELKKYYQEHKDYYTLPELVNVKHILILAPKDSPKEKSGEARAQIEDLLAKLKLGKNFSSLAKEYSEDPGSATKGGELGWIGKGETDPSFEQAAFSLKTHGELTGIIQSSFGYHIIQLVDRRENTIKKFEEVLTQVTENYKEELAQTKLQNIIEELSNSNLENEDLSNIANKFNLTIKTSGLFSNLGEPSGILSNKEVILAAFDPKNLTKNSELIPITVDHFIILKTIAKEPASKKTLAEAYQEIKQTLQIYAAKQEAESKGLNLAKELINSSSPNKLAKSYGLEWNFISKATRNTGSINQEILKVAFSLAKPKTQKTFTLANGDFVIIQLLNIHNANQNNDAKLLENTQVNTQLTMSQTQLEQQLYEQDLIKSAKIKIYKD